MKYRATITVEVDGADAPDSDFLYGLTNGIEEYLGFEGETVTVTVDIQPQSHTDGVVEGAEVLGPIGGFRPWVVQHG